jgi:hypothetical protein
MASPNFRPSMTMQWWAVGTTQGGSVSWTTVQSPSKPTAGAPVGPFSSQKAAQNWINNFGQGAQAGNGLSQLNPLNWLSSLGGDIASGLESGFINILKDIWSVIVGPLEVIAGALLAMAILTIYFKNDIGSVAGMIGML